MNKISSMYKAMAFIMAFVAVVMTALGILVDESNYVIRFGSIPITLTALYFMLWTWRLGIKETRNENINDT